MIECHEWEYNMTDGLGQTWMSEWNLVCDKKYHKIIAEMIFLVGVATGGIISGMLSDKFGRKKMLFISAVFQSFFGKYLFFFYSTTTCGRGFLLYLFFSLPFIMTRSRFILCRVLRNLFDLAGTAGHRFCFSNVFRTYSSN
jgi:MFS family permease